MRREVLKSLLAWKDSKNRKPLILQGARQVGKTFLLKEFGLQCFKNCHYFNFEEDQRLARIFETDLNPKRILNELRFHAAGDIDPARDLILFDEIQRCGRALTGLKYFCEEMPQLALCAAGSLLGVALHGESFPVGKVTFLDLHPMNFLEFLEGIGEQGLAQALMDQSPFTSYPALAHDRLWELWKHYLVVGGLPAAVMEYGRNRSNLFAAAAHVRKLQRDLINAYCADIAKHSGKAIALHIERLWRSVPQQLARNIDGSAPKFRFKDAVHGIRGYERLIGPISWLKSARLVINTAIIEKAAQPLSAYASENNFKLYMFDVGMLGALSDLQPRVIFDYGFGSYQGYIAENFVAQELRAAGTEALYCWQGRTSEVEFLLSTGKGILPLEVKSGTVTHAKSLDVFVERFHPESSYVLSGRNSERRGNRYFVPLYAAGVMFKKLASL